MTGSSSPLVALIWAEAADGVIGEAGSIPWSVPEDLAHFRQVTDGSTVVMGRRTWDSLPSRFRPLPGRRNVVVTRQTDWHADDSVVVVHSLEEALADGGTETSGTTWVIGGDEIYRQALPMATRIEITEVDLQVDGDTRAPELGPGWRTTTTPENGWLHSRTGIRYRFVTRTRNASHS